MISEKFLTKDLHSKEKVVKKFCLSVKLRAGVLSKRKKYSRCALERHQLRKESNYKLHYISKSVTSPSHCWALRLAPRCLEWQSHSTVACINLIWMSFFRWMTCDISVKQLCICSMGWAAIAIQNDKFVYFILSSSHTLCVVRAIVHQFLFYFLPVVWRILFLLHYFPFLFCLRLVPSIRFCFIYNFNHVAIIVVNIVSLSFSSRWFISFSFPRV